MLHDPFRSRAGLLEAEDYFWLEPIAANDNLSVTGTKDA
jgi:hypothetical protein